MASTPSSRLTFTFVRWNAHTSPASAAPDHITTIGAHAYRCSDKVLRRARATGSSTLTTRDANEAGPALNSRDCVEEQEQGQSVRQTMQKEAEELADWMRSLTQQGQQGQHNQASQNAMFDAPPPAYNAIDFSHPPHASAPHPPLHPLLTSLPPAPSLVT